MINTLQVSDVRFIGAPEKQVETGLLGWLSFVVDGSLRVDGCTLRRTLDGRLVVSFPARKDAEGRQHPLVRPLGDRSRRDLEHQILTALGLAERTAP